MLNNNLDNKLRSRAKIFSPTTSRPPISLNLHTMPQTATGHFKKWLVLSLIIFGLLIIVAILALW